MKKLLPLLAVIALLMAACSDEGAAPTTTTSDDRSPVYIDSVEFLYLESLPVQVRAVISGNLPTPCHEFHWELDALSAVAPAITAYSTVDPDVSCAQVLEPFEETVDIGPFEPGSYVLEVNGDPYPFEI